MTTIARSVTALGSPILLSVFFAIAMLAFYRLEWKRPAITLAEVMAGAIVCNIGLKSPHPARAPRTVLRGRSVELQLPERPCIVLALLLWRDRERARGARARAGRRIGIWVAAALLIAGIGLSRVYLGVHYPSDVIAGYLSAAFVIGAVLAFSPGWS